MTYEEIVLELKAAQTPEVAVDVVLALLTEVYEEGYAAAVGDERARSLRTLLALEACLNA